MFLLGHCEFEPSGLFITPAIGSAETAND